MPTPSQRFYSSVAQQTTVTGALSNTATTVPVAATTGLPSAPFCAAIDYGTGSEELVLVTNVAGLNLTVTRGFSGSSAVGHSSGAVFQHVHVSQDFTDFSQHLFAGSGVHGVVGAVVGTTDAQTLTNKTIISPAITGTPTLNGANAVDVSSAQALSHKDLTDPTNAFPATLATTTGTQALTNKDLSDPSNTLPASVVTLAGAQTVTNKTLGTGTVVGAGNPDLSGYWTAFTPTLTNMTLGNGSVSGAYMRTGKTCHVYIFLAAGSTTTYTSTGAKVSLPFAASANIPEQGGGAKVYTGSAIFLGAVAVGSSQNTAAIYAPTSSGSSTVAGMGTATVTPGTAGNMSIHITYETA